MYICTYNNITLKYIFMYINELRFIFIIFDNININIYLKSIIKYT